MKKNKSPAVTVAAPGQSQANDSQDRGKDFLLAICEVLRGNASRIDIRLTISGVDYIASTYRLHGTVPCRIDFKPVAVN